MQLHIVKVSITSYIKKSFIFNFVWSLTFSRDARFLTTRATVIDTQIPFEWIGLTFRPQDINDKTHHILTDIRGIEYFQGIVNIRGNRIRSISRIDSFAFTTQPGPSPSIGRSVTLAHSENNTGERIDMTEAKIKILFNLYVHRKGVWLVHKIKSAMIGFLSLQSLNQWDTS